MVERNELRRETQISGTPMADVDEIKRVIAGLADEQKSALKRWLDEMDAEIFDAKIEADAASGRLDGLIAKAKANYRAGRRSPL
jgi:hypothetical protein